MTWCRFGLRIVVLAGSFVLVPARFACAEAPEPVTHVSLNPIGSIDRTKFKSFIEAPLFDPSRSLPPVAPPPPPPPPPPPHVVLEAPPPGLHLLGIIQGKRDIAVVRLDDGGKTAMYYSGDHIGDWEVKVLPSGGMEIRNGDRVSTFTMFDPNAPPPKDAPPSDTPPPL